MSEPDVNPKKRSRREWSVWIILAVVILYPLSFGPAFWIASRFADPPPAFMVLSTIYRPVIIASIECPAIVQHPIAGYLNLGAPRSASIQFYDGTSIGLLSEHSRYTFTWGSHQNSWTKANP